MFKVFFFCFLTFTFVSNLYCSGWHQELMNVCALSLPFLRIFFLYKVKHCSFKWDCINFFVINVRRISDVVLKDVIYPFFFSVDECRSTLIQFGVQDITPSSVARVIGKKMMLPKKWEKFSLFSLSTMDYVYERWNGVECTSALVK